jgi:hypothetical protein
MVLMIVSSISLETFTRFQLFIFKTIAMEKENTTFHFNESVRNTIIVVLIFGVIAAISYAEWKAKLG